MATLEAGVQYGLQSNFNENKNLLFVKLTDSALRQIINYCKNQHLIGKKPTIQFGGNEGRLYFPSSDGHDISFTFSLSGNQDIEGPSGGFECIQRTGTKSLESLGTIPYKMRIHANDDVYETTRHRMVIAEENNKNKCTRVIKANGPNIGRKVKVTGTGRTIPPPSNARHRESSFSTNQIVKRSPSYRSTTRNSPEKKIPEIMRRPLKERLIHLLALRPFKKPELHDRLNKEGMRDREKPIMTTLLKQVAFMRDNTYHLHMHMWNDVQEDWPFYSEQEKAVLRRRKPQNLTPPGSSDGSTGSGQSPNSIQPGSPPAITAPPPSLLGNKRPGYYQGNDGLPTKKPRISHYRKSETNTSGGDSRRTASSGGSGLGGIRGVSPTVGGNSASRSGGGTSNSGGSGFSGGWDQRQQQRERRGDCRPERTANTDVLRGGNGYGAAAGGSRSCQVSPSVGTNNQSGYGRSGAAATASGNVGSSLFSATPGSHNFHSSPAYSNSVIGGSNGGERQCHAGRSTAMVASGDNSVCSASVVDNGARCAQSSSRNDNVNVSVGYNVSSAAGGYSGSPNSGSVDRRDKNDRIRSGVREERDWESWTIGGGSGASSYNDSTDSTTNCDLPNITDNLESPRISDVGTLVSGESPPALGSPVALLESSQVPDYLTYFTTISNKEQRRRYKLAFNAHYEEYRRVHSQLVQVSNVFMQLNQQLIEQKKLGNLEECKRIRQQILTEYKERKRDPIHEQTRKQYNYLHHKLDHIKKLVADFDTRVIMEKKKLADNSAKGSTNENSDNRHY